MNSSPAAPRPASTGLWAGRIITALVVAFMIFDLIGKLLVIQPVIDAQTHLGFPVELSTTLGVIEIVCVALYVIPPTTWIGALLLTAYLGGATAIQVRVGDPFYFPVMMGLLLWLGFVLRDSRLRALLPWPNQP